MQNSTTATKGISTISTTGKINVFGYHDHQNLPKGWRFRETPGHGYLIPSEADNQNVPEDIREREYEEDCAYNIPVVFNAHLFKQHIGEEAVQSFKHWFPEAYIKHIGPLQKGESRLNDDFLEYVENHGNYEKAACYGDWCFDITQGMVYMELRKVNSKTAMLGKVMQKFDESEEISVMVPEEMYNRKGRFYTFEELQPYLYERNTDYYTWDDYEQKTGRKRNR